MLCVVFVFGYVVVLLVVVGCIGVEFCFVVGLLCYGCFV